MHKVHSEDLHYSVVMMTDVVGKAGGYSLTDMHVMKSQLSYSLTRFVPFAILQIKYLMSQMPYTYQNIQL